MINEFTANISAYKVLELYIYLKKQSSLAVFLGSGTSGFMTGSNFIVDCGYTLRATLKEPISNHNKRVTKG